MMLRKLIKILKWLRKPIEEMNWYYKAKVIKILSYDRVDLSIDLGFHIRYRMKVNLLVDDVDEQDRVKAKSCLITILGGHRIVVKMLKEEDNERYIADAYLMYFVPLEGVSSVVIDKKLPSVKKLMQVASNLKFESNVLHLKLNRSISS